MVGLSRFKPIPKHVDHALFHEIALKNYNDFMKKMRETYGISKKMERMEEVTEARDAGSRSRSRD